MKKKNRIIIFSIMAVFILIIMYLVWGVWSVRNVSNSHLETNVVEQQYFDEYLKRDLLSYFVTNIDTNAIRIEYELLRDGPTQSGLALPKYYIWVRVYNSGGIITEGAMRVAAAEKDHFIITNSDFLSYDEIKSNPDVINTLFPESVVEKIKAKI